MNIRKKTCLIIKKDNRYLVGLNVYTHSLNWSLSPWDAWRTRDIAIARAVVGKTGGTLCLFNPIAAQIKEV